MRELDLSVGEGEVVALLGANGAGKTTTLRAVSGIVDPMAGSIAFGGRDLAGASISGRARMGIAHVPENRGLFFGLTVAEHFRLGHRGERLDAEAAYRYFPALAELRDRRCGLLSGGEQQMLAVARALARHPKLLLLDELSLGLAPLIVEACCRSCATTPPTPAAACCWSSSTSSWRWGSPTAATCSRTARWCCRTEPRRCGATASC